MINYDRMNRSGPKLKGQLTRAINSGQFSSVLAACQDAVHEWNEIGAWPDNWHRWQIALDDALLKADRDGFDVVSHIDLRDVDF